MQDQSSKLWISTSHSSQLDCFQTKPTKSLRWHPAKWKSPSWSTSIANPNMSEWWPHSKARARPRDHVWRLINALGCNSTNLMRFSSLCPTSRSIPLRLLPKEQRPLDPPWPGATSQAQKRCRTSGWSGFKWILRCLRHKTYGCLDYLQILTCMTGWGIAVNNHVGCRKFWAPQALPDSKVSLIKPLPRRKQIRF